MENGLGAVVLLFLEAHDFTLTVHDESKCDALHTSCRQLRLDLAPENRGELETDEPVQHTPCLLRVHEIHVNVPRCLDRILDGSLCDFVENDSLGILFLESESLEKVP